MEDNVLVECPLVHGTPVKYDGVRFTYTRRTKLRINVRQKPKIRYVKIRTYDLKVKYVLYVYTDRTMEIQQHLPPM